MNIQEIDSILRGKRERLDSAVGITILELKEKAIQQGDEGLSNVLWCYEKVYSIQSQYLSVYNNLKQAYQANDELRDGYNSDKSELYESAWNGLDRCDIDISFLEKNICIKNASLSDYHIEEILQDIKRLQPLFPYKVFLSRETIIKSQKCSICGKTVSVRNPCGHIPGLLYCGQMCLHEITDLEFLNENLVTNPFDKYAILKLKDTKFDFSLLDYIVPMIFPYKAWSYTVEKRLLPKFRGIGRNAKCPCGSGLKYKRCIQNDTDRHFEMHYSFRI